MSELAGKVCVVTGGRRGIGSAIGQSFARAGARIAIVDSEPGLDEDLAATLKTERTDHREYQVDVADEAQVAACARAVAADFGGVDILVNNAGISRLGPSLSFSLKDWNDSFAVLATGVFLCSREFAPHLRERGGGSIVNISSLNGLVAFPMRLAYSAAKAAVISMTKVLAAEWAAYGIRVNAVAPGMIRTAMLDQVIAEGLIDVDAYMAHTPLSRFGRPEDIAEAVTYLASPRAAFVTGHVLVADGGWTAFNWIPWSGDPDAPEIARQPTAGTMA